MNVIEFYRSGKGVPVLYYAAGFLSWLRPRWLLQWRRRRLLASVDKRPDRDYILDRVNYYCQAPSKTDGPKPIVNPVPAGSPAWMKDFPTEPVRFTPGSYRKMGSRYFIDLSRILRYFPRSAKYLIFPEDVWQNPSEPLLIKARRYDCPHPENGVLLNLDRLRLQQYPHDNIPFEKKIPKLLFRGECYGKPHRFNFLERWFDHPLCDIGDTERRHPSRYKKERMTIPEHFKYRYVLVFEGHDVASSHQWVMASGCVPVMTRPKVDGWFMQRRMIPGVHYIEIADDYSDVAEKLEYYDAHPEEARKIAEASTRWARQFYNHKRELIISLLTVQRYLMTNDE